MPDQKFAKPINEMPPIINVNSRTTFESIGKFDYSKYALPDDFSECIKLGPYLLEDNAVYEG